MPGLGSGDGGLSKWSKKYRKRTSREAENFMSRQFEHRYQVGRGTAMANGRK